MSFVRGVYNFLGSVSLPQKFEMMDGPALQPSDGPAVQLRVTAQFYLESKGEHADPKDPKRREAPSPILAPIFMCFCILPLDLPM